MPSGLLPASGTLAVLALLLNAATWGLSWWPFRHLQGAGLHALWSTALVYAASALVVTFWRPRAWRQLTGSPRLWLIMLASGCTNAGFNWAVTIGDVARVALLFYLMPVWAVVLARWVLGERADAQAWLGVALALAGALLVLSGSPSPDDADGPSRPGSMPPLADALAILAGFSFALNNVMLRRCADLPDEGRSLAMFVGGTVVAAALAAAGAASIGALAQSGIGWPPVPSAGWVVPALALSLAFLAANLALQYGAARLPASVTAVVMPSEVVFAAVSAAWWAGEAIGQRVWIGGACILGATLLGAWRRD